jgi:competence protein ComEA
MRTPILLLTLAACVALAADDDEDAKKLPDGAGKDAVVAACFACHGPGHFRKARLTKDEWADKVADMMDRGAQATDAQVAAIVDYLAQNFGKNSKLWINTAPYEELRSVLKLTVKEAQALTEWRDQNGSFKNLEELKKVAGVDAGKIDAKKDVIAF